jgi:hypothetical protein
MSRLNMQITSEDNINNTRFVGLDICAVGK